MQLTGNGTDLYPYGRSVLEPVVSSWCIYTWRIGGLNKILMLVRVEIIHDIFYLLGTVLVTD